MTLSSLIHGIDSKYDQFRKLSDIGRAFTYTTTRDEVARLTVDRGADSSGPSQPW
jgi:hypothetical protein